MLHLLDNLPFSSFEGAEVTDGKVTVSCDLELIANYTSKNGTVNFDLDLDKYAVGTSKKSSGSSSPTFDNNYAIGNDWNTTNTRNKFEYTGFEIVEIGGAKVLKYAHNGAGELKLGSSLAGTGIGDAIGFTFEISVMAGANGTFPTTTFRIDRQGDISGAVGGTSPNFIRLEDNGDITLCDVDVTKNVVIGKGDSTKFQTISVVYNAAEGTFTGYVDGVEKATTNATIDPLYFYASLEGTNNRLRMTAYGGYNGGNWVSVDGYPTALIDAGVFTVTEATETNTVKDIETGLYRNIDTKNEAEVELYKDAQRYSVKYNDVETSRPAIEAYLNANQYFYLSDAKLIVGNAMAD